MKTLLLYIITTISIFLFALFISEEDKQFLPILITLTISSIGSLLLYYEFIYNKSDNDPFD